MIRIARPNIFWRVVFAGTAVILFFSIVPTDPYRPLCGSYYRDRTYIEGPLRPVYQAIIEDFLREEKFYYWKIRNKVYIRRFNIFDGTNSIDRHYLHRNLEHKVIGGIAKGYTATDERTPPPQALLEAIRNTEHIYGPFDPESSLGPSERFEDCAVKRAGAIWTEKLDNPELFPKSRLDIWLDRLL